MTSLSRRRTAGRPPSVDREFWARREPDGSYVIGFTGAAQRRLGPVDFFQGPAPGRRYRAEEWALTVESEKCVRQLPLPAGGTVVESNPGVESDPGEINRDPYGKGWVCRLRPWRTRAIESATERVPRRLR